MTTSPLIEDHALLGNSRSTALVDRSGTITWLCLPEPDSPAVFARLLGTDDHGFWRLAPADPTRATLTRRAYREGSLVLDQDWKTPGGVVRVTDFMPVPIDGTVPTAQLTRIVTGLRGRVQMRSRLRAGFGFGLTTPLPRFLSQGAARRTVFTHKTDELWLDGPAHSLGDQHTAYADVSVRAGDQIAFTITWRAGTEAEPAVPDGLATFTDSLGGWSAWSSRCTHAGPYREAVLSSAAVLKSLTHTPTGGIIAAPTTSLPEEIGGERNWDYRAAWPRDSAMTVVALLRSGSHRAEARAWRSWLLRSVELSGHLRAIYQLRGGTDLTERVLSHLPGYAGSLPVRIGNGAADQLQLDVYGHIAEAFLVAEDAGLEPDPNADALLVALAAEVIRLWRQPDEGIWEIRGPRRHFVHSKVMAWVFMDRTITLLSRRGRSHEHVLARLRKARAEIHDDVCANGYDPRRNTFTQYYGGEDLDAALLVIPLVGFLPSDDKRVIGTVEAVQRELSTAEGLVRRYPTHTARDANVDGLEGHEGAFLLCSFWLVRALHALGRTEEACGLFGRILELRNDLGLLAEEYDPTHRLQLGNYPQALSHIGVIEAAVDLAPQPVTHVPGQRGAAFPIRASA
ncbi:glycoside hydrolase family 15 protein [Kitasatospora sp. NPDC127067]|uniref:glycoside hydrolase family 15 protein n=1 Tax=Kitasatospora sp. NPDC127067 TaxID=3347126 RepID=UPI003653EB57